MSKQSAGVMAVGSWSRIMAASGCGSGEIAAINAGRGGNDAAGRPVPPQGPYWDLDLLTPDDVAPC